MNSGTGKFIQGTGLELLAKLTAIMTGFGINIILARRFGPSEYAIVGAIQSVLVIYEILLTNGVRQSTSRFISSHLYAENSIRRFSFRVQAVFCLLLVAICLLSAQKLSGLLHIREYVSYFIFNRFDFSVGGTLFSSTRHLQWQNELYCFSSANIIYSSIRFIFIVIFVFILNNGVYSIIIGTLIGYLIAGMSVYLRLGKSDDIGRSVDKKDYLMQSFNIIVLYFFITLYLNVDYVYIKMIAFDITHVGSYKAMMTIGQAIYFVFSAVSITTYPMVAQRFFAKDFDGLNRMLRSIFSIMTLFSGTIIILCTVFSKLIIQLLFGKQYMFGATILPSYSIAMVLLGMGVFTSNIIMAILNSRRVAVLYTINMATYIFSLVLMKNVLTIRQIPIILSAFLFVLLVLLLFVLFRNTNYIFINKETIVVIGSTIAVFLLSMHFSDEIPDTLVWLIIRSLICIVYIIFILIASKNIRYIIYIL
jgi:stage V sporulation protein B